MGSLTAPSRKTGLRLVPPRRAAGGEPSVGLDDPSRSRILRPVVAWIVAMIVLVCSVPQTEAAHGRFLRDPAKSKNVGTWDNDGGGTSPVAFDSNVTVGGDLVGTIKFDYDTFLGKGANPTRGGASLSGGFYLNSNNFAVMPGYTLEWVQTVFSTRSGQNNWGINPATNGGEFPDATPKDRAANPTFAPSYALITTAQNPPNGIGAPTLGFQDTPSRGFANGTQNWLAELGLVCIANTPNAQGVRQVDVIDSFLWGFTLTAGTIAVQDDPPSLWGPPTASFLNTLNSYYSTGTSPGGVATDKYSFAACQDCFMAVPEPPSVVLLGISTVLLLGYALVRRRSPRAA
jgi:hypothetical protein